MHEQRSFLKYKNPYISLIEVGWVEGNTLISHSDSDLFDSYYTIYVINRGKGILTIDNQMYNLKNNDAFLIKPNQKANYIADSNDTCDYAYFSFSGVLMEMILKDLVFNNSPIYSMEEDAVFRIIEEFVSKIDKCKSVRVFSLECLFRLLSEFVSDNEYIDYVVDNALLSQVEEYILEHYTESIQVGEIADHYNINRNHLFRMFKKKHGVSIKSYIMMLKVEKAKQMILNTDMSFSKISRHLGFLNYPTFLRIFKIYTGKAPGEYRDLLNEDSVE